jgi:Ca-activated chloride channel homolog
MSFLHPPWLLGLPLLAVLAVLRWSWFERRRPVLKHSLVCEPEASGGRSPLWKLILPEALLLLGLACAIVALARPVSFDQRQDLESEGIDILLVLDISGSMRAMDLKPDRLEAARAVALEFVDARPRDRIGLVVFAGEAFTQCPLTLDHELLKGLLREVQPGSVPDGTAIGSALATALNRLRESEAPSRVMVLLTDGENNRGLDPRTAGELATALGVRVYTVGAGRDGVAPIPVQTPFGMQVRQMEVQIDEELLGEIAGRTGGRYFRAQDRAELEAVYRRIDELETATITVTEHRLIREGYRPWLLAAALLLLASRLALARWRPLPA